MVYALPCFADGKLKIENGNFQEPGDLWAQGGGKPDGWDIANHPFKKAPGKGKGGGNMGLNHRWNPLDASAGRSLYLINPENAVVSQKLKGSMKAGNRYTLRCGFYRYDRGPAAIAGSLLVDGKPAVTFTCDGDAFPYRKWVVKELSYVAGKQDEGKEVKVSFKITGKGDVRLDEVSITTMDPREAAMLGQVDGIKKQVEGLKDTAAHEKRKKAALELALERINFCILAGEFERAQELIADVKGATGKDIGHVNIPKEGLGFLPGLKVVDGNPYLDAMYKWIEDKLAKPDIPWKKATADFNPFTGLGRDYGTRSEAQDMGVYFWLAAHPQSKYRENPEVLARLLRRAHAYIDAYDVHATKYQDSLNDFFAIGPALYAFMATDKVFGDLLLPGDKLLWDKTVKKAGMFWQKVYSDGSEGPYRMGWYANRDLGVANILLNASVYLNDSNLRKIADSLIDAQQHNLYPDGAWAYIGTQNESCGYHDADTTFFARYYAVSGYNIAKEQLIKSQWYTPLSIEPGNVADYWTAPSWKHAWNTGYSTGGEMTAAVTGNRYIRALLDRMIVERGAAIDPLSAAWYRDDITPAEYLDEYTVYDRNIQGPRGRYGRFSYAATTRVPNDDEPGKATIMGAMILDAITKDAYPLNATLMEVMPKVLVKPAANKKPTWAWLTHKDRNNVTTGKNFAAISADYQLHTWGSSRKGVEVPWRASQQWICIGDRIFGMLEVAPIGVQQAFDIKGSARLGFGGVGRLRPRELESVDQYNYNLGDLALTIHETNFTNCGPEETKVRIAKAFDITCSNRKAGQKEFKTPITCQPDKPYYFIIEVKPRHITDNATVKRIATVDGVPGLSVETNGKKFMLWHNRTDSIVRVNTSDSRLPNVKSSLRWPRQMNKKPLTFVPRTSKIQPNSHIVIVSSNDSADHKPGWTNFPDMVKEMEKQK